MNYDHYVDRDGNIYSSWSAYILNIPMKKKENTTMYTTSQSLKFQIEETERQLAKLKAELEAANNPYGEDRFIDGTVLRFSMRYDWGGKKYDFAVIKSALTWYPTGQLGKLGRSGRTWELLCDTWRTYDVQPASISVLTTSHALSNHMPF